MLCLAYSHLRDPRQWGSGVPFGMSLSRLSVGVLLAVENQLWDPRAQGSRSLSWIRAEQTSVKGQMGNVLVSTAAAHVCLCSTKAAIENVGKMHSRVTPFAQGETGPIRDTGSMQFSARRPRPRTESGVESPGAVCGSVYTTPPWADILSCFQSSVLCVLCALCRPCCTQLQCFIRSY